MTKKEKKLLEINGLDRQIEKYRSNILELEEEYKFIKISYDEIVEKSYTPTKNYDFSALSVYGEDMQRKAEEYRRSKSGKKRKDQIRKSKVRKK